ncbi:site-specific integrase [Geomonas terrae]|uniref:Site-specific integrase n=1 Tax=Geomonas terrae TaxID=2562681 RepID=A0A4S1C9I7_9BACT|nr:site-specific integrase [Geomonas terrae]
MKRAIIAIQGFYRWFAGHVEVFVPVHTSAQRKFNARNKVKHSFMYGQIYEVHVDEILDIENMRLKPSGYKKHWLTEAEKKAFLDSFHTERDKAIFMLLCEGMRIDEALSIKYSAYDSDDLTVKPSRSKGYTDEYEDKFRIIAFHDQRTSEYIDRYIQTERADVETALDDYLVPMFVNLKKHDVSYGKAVTYRNWWGVLKTAAKKVGIDPTEIATHVGRRSFIQEKLEEGEDPEIIRQMVGWASQKPLDAYRDTRSKKVIKNAAERRRSRW